MNDVTSSTYSDWTNSEYMSDASVDARNTRKASANDAAGYEALKYESYKPEDYKYNPYGEDVSNSSSNQQTSNPSYNPGPAEYGSFHSKSKGNPTAGYREYANFEYKPNEVKQFDFRSGNSSDKSMNIDFSFNPNRFNQGQ